MNATAIDPTMNAARFERYANLKAQATLRTNDVRCYVDGGLRAALDAFEDGWTDAQREYFAQLAWNYNLRREAATVTA